MEFDKDEWYDISRIESEGFNIDAALELGVPFTEDYRLYIPNIEDVPMFFEDYFGRGSTEMSVAEGVSELTRRHILCCQYSSAFPDITPNSIPYMTYSPWIHCNGFDSDHAGIFATTACVSDWKYSPVQSDVRLLSASITENLLRDDSDDEDSDIPSLLSYEMHAMLSNITKVMALNSNGGVFPLFYVTMFLVPGGMGPLHNTLRSSCAVDTFLPRPSEPESSDLVKAVQYVQQRMHEATVAWLSEQATKDGITIRGLQQDDEE